MVVKSQPLPFEGRLFVGVSEIAEVFGWDERTIRKAIKVGEIPATKAGATYRVPVAWVHSQALLDGAA